jgi:hypothetical protein
MTFQQIKWARQHDWYDGFQVSQESDDSYACLVTESGTQLHPDGSVTSYTEPKVFINFRDLKDWAGY